MASIIEAIMNDTPEQAAARAWFRSQSTAGRKPIPDDPRKLPGESKPNRFIGMTADGLAEFVVSGSGINPK